MALFTQPTIQDGVLYTALRGELDQHAAAALRAAFALLLHEPTVHSLQLDMQQVTLMDSSGIGLLIGWYRIVQARGGRMVLHQVQPVVARVMRISGLYQIMQIREAA